VQCALVEKQDLARFLSGAKEPAPTLLAAFTKLWEQEWRQGIADLAAVPSPGSPSGYNHSRCASAPAAVAAPAPTPSAESDALARIRRLIRRETVAPAEEKNGDMIVSALRSFFAEALHVAQLEANNVMRIVEAFASSLASDNSFVVALTPSMLPLEQRQSYRTPEEILFGLTYTTMMLNTDVHSTQVGQKTWDHQKFIAAGKDCGVQGALMAQIYKRVSENEL